MVLQIIHLIVLTATLTCCLAVALYAQRIHATQSREIAFLDARDVVRARPTPRVETKAICRECDGGFVAVGNGGIGQCYACNGSGFIDAR